ncbi:MAG TPA: hypothetical protein VE825_05580, partial [Terriglobales bacterium]|nr:hypothetical protein [Terriglobales bacterium]
MKAPLQFSYENAMESVVGADGLLPNELDQTGAIAALDAFRKRVDSGEIGFPNLPDDRTTVRAVSEFAADMRGEVDDVIVVGIGGSALGAYALDVALRGPHPVQVAVGRSTPSGRTKSRRPGSAALPRLVVLDNVDPGFIAAALERVNPKRALACVIAKSGSTAESLSTFMIVREWLGKALGKRARSRIVAVTDAQKGDLLTIAKQEQYPLFFVPGNVGGRFSVFTPVGLVPAALIGLDIGKLMSGAADANLLAWSRDFDHNQALSSAVVHHALNTRRAKSIEIVYAYS